MELNHEILSQLISEKGNSIEPCISIYVPTSRAGTSQEDRIRLKNALSKVVEKLVDKGWTKKDSLKYLAEAYALHDDEQFWLYQSDCLAIFLKGEKCHYFRLPGVERKMVHIDNQFFIRPLAGKIQEDKRFFILALSQNEVRFFEGHPNHIIPVNIKDITPQNLEMAIGGDGTTSSHVKQHNNGSNVFYHGQGAGKDDKNEELTKYFRLIDSGLMEMLHDEKAPLVIHAVDYLVPIYRSVSQYSNIVNNHVSGNPENDDPVLIHEKAWSAIQPYFESKYEAEKNLFHSYRSRNWASTFSQEIIPASIEGRVDVLYIQKNTKRIWGKYEPKSHTVKFHSKRKQKSEALLELAVRGVLNSGGVVHCVEESDMPEKNVPICAVYRYARS